MTFSKAVKRLQELGLYEEVLNGGTLQYKRQNKAWMDIEPTSSLLFHENKEFRIKPVPTVEDYEPFTRKAFEARYKTSYLLEIRTNDIFRVTGFSNLGAWINSVFYTYAEILTLFRSTNNAYLGTLKKKFIEVNSDVKEDEEGEEDEEDE